MKVYVVYEFYGGELCCIVGIYKTKDAAVHAVMTKTFEYVNEHMRSEYTYTIAETDVE